MSTSERVIFKNLPCVLVNPIVFFHRRSHLGLSDFCALDSSMPEIDSGIT